LDNRRVFTFLNDRLTSGEAAVLVTVTAVEGSSMRGPGTHMGVAEDGSFAGSLSGGCIENAVVAEALDTLNDGKPRVVRFGSGSPYIDIKLPCGGGLDIHFQPLRDATWIGQCLHSIAAREPFSINVTLASDDALTIEHWPEPKLLIIGHGATVSSLAKLARQMDLTVEVLSPDQQLLEGLREHRVATSQLAKPEDTSAIKTDRWTAIVFLFHDHDWEIALMAHALAQPHFYVGAMGGRKAHAFRTEALKALGVSDDAIATIHAPIGLFHSSRDPDSLALSTLGQVIASYHQQDFGDVGK
jgi:xanthine dehydrogenase accessory factor